MRSEETVERAIGQYADMVRRLCMLHLKNEADTEDIFQTVFLKYAPDTTDFAGPDHEKAWLLRVTINACKDLRRSLFRRRTVPLDALEALPAAVTPDHREVLEAVLALAQMESCTASVDNTHCCLGEAGEVEAARELGLSYGKYSVYLALQALDPSGVCARTLEECLKLQLERRDMLTPVLESIIDNCLEMVAKNQIPAIARKLRLSPTETAGYCQIIKSLNPKPGVSFSSRDQLRYIIPDVTIVKFKDHFDILLNESMYPTIELNSYYRQMNQNPESSELKEYLGNKIRQAEWVKQCVTQRGKTLMQVSRAILEHQEEFFTFGPAHLNPLRLADIAQELDIHESTVSRAVSKKYLQCSWGVYPMNFFFSRSVAVQESSSESGTQSVTAADIKRVLREIIEEENKKKPYSDRLLGEKLAERGISISRRTVAKYREEEGIADASGRKEYV